MTHNPTHKRLTKTVVLLGMMGAGKSTLGRLLAQQIGVAFKDSDAEITQAANMSIAAMFAEHGEAYFRTKERTLIADLLAAPPMIIAIGGGAFMDDATRASIKAKAVSVWLNVPLATLLQRLQQQANKDAGAISQRPLLEQPDPAQALADLLAQREDVYAQADIIIKTSAETPAIAEPQTKTVNSIIAELSACAILV